MNDIKRGIQWFTCAISVMSAFLFTVPSKAETLLSDFDNYWYPDEFYLSWGTGDAPMPLVTNFTISRAGFGGAWAPLVDTNFVPIIDASGENTLELMVTIGSTNVPPDTVVAGPLVALEDEDGTLWKWEWSGYGNGSHVLIADMASPSYMEQPGTNAGLDLTNLVNLHIQAQPGGDPDVYTITFENLRALYVEPPAPKCDALVSDFNFSGVLGGYDSWAGNVPPPQPDNWTITATAFGGGWQNINPNIDASLETMIELRVTLTNLTGLVGPIVVLQDVDGTQEIWPWYGLTNGSHVLASSLSAGQPVLDGGIPGMNFSNLAWFHVQIDGGSNVTYTATFENLRFFGFDPTITAFAFDPGSSLADLTWDSRPDRSYSVSYISDLTGTASVLQSNILSGGISTSNSVVVPPGDIGFLQVSEECE